MRNVRGNRIVLEGEIMEMKYNGRVLFVASACFLVFSLAFGACSASVAARYKTYSNDRFGYSVEYPDIFWSRFESDNGDGVTLAAANGHIELIVWGRHNIDGKSAAELLKEKVENAAHIVPDSEASGEGWYSLTVTDDGGLNGVEHHSLEYGIVTGETIAVFLFRFPLDKGFEATAEHLKKTLRFGAKAGDELAQFDLRTISPLEYALSLDDGKVYREAADGTRTAIGDPTEVATEMGSYYWFAVAPTMGDAMQGSASGIYLFYESGNFAGFLPTEAAEFVGDVRINATAEQALIDYGTSPERDLRLYDLQTLKEMRVFSAMSDIVWLDATRFAMTHIDPEKKGRHSNAQESGWLSVAIYDTNAEKLLYTRKATETSDFMLDGVNVEKRQLVISERSVKKAGDWAEDAKIATNELRVEY